MPDRSRSRRDTVLGIDGLLWELAQRYRREVFLAYEQHDLTNGDVSLIEALAHGAVTPTALRHALGWVAPNVTMVLRRLEARGFIKRARNPLDARSTQVTLTTAGMELVATVKETRQVRLETVLTDFPTKERERLQSYLSRLKDALTTLSKTN